MDMLKPDTLHAAAQPFDWRGAPHHAFSALLGIDMATGGALAADAALSAAMQALPPGCRLDAGIPKRQAEWLLAGTVTPQTREGSVIEIRVGKSRRRFLVLPGPDGAPVPLNWEATAFDAEANPLGSKDAPRVVDPALPHGAPACPLPLGAWPCRMRNMGTYDAHWLQTRWPGLPDDADWQFFNEAQPQQRLSDGLRGDEEISLSAFGPQLPAQSFRLPGSRLRLDILRAGEQVWKEHAVSLDTLWLFPAQRTALLCWHALVPCADEAASDIAAVRFVLAPDALNAASASASPTAVAGAAAVVGMAAAVAGSAVTAEADGSGGTPSPDAPAGAAPTAEAATTDQQAAGQTVGQTAGQAAEQAAGQVPGQAPPPQPTDPAAAEISAALHAELEANLSEINAALAEAGLPPLSPSQLEETRRRLAELSAAVVNLREAPPPPLEYLLRQAGLSEERIAAVNSALELEVPHPGDYGDNAAWQAASEAFVDKFSRLMQPSEAQRASLSQMLRLVGPDSEQACRVMAGNPSESAESLLQQAGMSPTEADRLLNLLDNAPDDPAALSAHARRMETELGYPPGSITGHLARYEAALRELESRFPAEAAAPTAETAQAGTGDGAYAAASSATAAPAAPAANGADTGFATATADPHAAPDAAHGDAPLSRAAVLAVLAVGGTLTGVSLAGADLSGLRLDGQNLAGADLRGANLRGASLVDADLRGAKLAGADAAEACFLRADLSRADLGGIRAPDADFSGADLTEADATGADFSAALFHESRAPGLKAAQARLESARLRHSDLSGADLSAASLRGADLHALCLDRAGLRGANLADAALGHGTRAAGADLTQAALSGSVWTDVAAPGAVFRQAEASGGSFADCDFAAADWTAVRARQADFTRCSLRGASLRRADLFEASLREARLHGADAREANLYGADLYRLGLDGNSRLDGADLGRTIVAARKGRA